mgnify:CR=1 FL=1
MVDCCRSPFAIDHVSLPSWLIIALTTSGCGSGGEVVSHAELQRARRRYPRSAPHGPPQGHPKNPTRCQHNPPRICVGCNAPDVRRRPSPILPPGQNPAWMLTSAGTSEVFAWWVSNGLRNPSATIRNRLVRPIRCSGCRLPSESSGTPTIRRLGGLPRGPSPDWPGRAPLRPALRIPIRRPMPRPAPLSAIRIDALASDGARALALLLRLPSP